MKKIILIFISLTILFFGYLYFLVNNSQVDYQDFNEKIINFEVLDESKLQTYINKEYGYSVKFPKDWNSEEVATGSLFRHPAFLDTVFWWEIRRYATGN